MLLLVPTPLNLSELPHQPARNLQLKKKIIVECEGCQIHCLNYETGNQRLHGFGEDGFFAEYAIIDYRNAIILPEIMDLKSRAVFCAGGKSPLCV
jgi:NADPH:quinone reductase-like Zn-dependent oxidoreductase